MTHSKILINQWRNRASSRDQLGHQLAFTKNDDELMSFTPSFVAIFLSSARNSFWVTSASFSIVIFFYALCLCKPTRAAKGVKPSCRDGDTVLAGLPHHLGRLEEEDHGDGEAQGRSRLEVDDELELHRLLNREVPG